eukprot:TRINITY_DN27253_c0_g2_i1.p1 TRINITY_DN27253_c0_g2~~TRINITY_DN27253_c0_g2_i1.p1  ORF type:complete len:585 (+),score=69.85 TRINITY_DN27253_c0_g2_i1:40-1794(+)
MGVVYAVLWNGIWDDPAVANTGAIAVSFAAASDRAGFKTGRIAPYLTWRFCYLLCSAVFNVVRLGLGYSEVSKGNEAMYTQFLTSQLPAAVEAKRFESLVSFLAYEELFMWLLSFIGTMVLLVSVFVARPSCAVSRLRLSRRLTWGSWLTTFLPPFLLFLLFPIRSLVDWQGVVADVCKFNVEKVVDMPGSSMRETMTAMAQNGILEKELEGIVNTEKWCTRKGQYWADSFFNVSVGCSWSLEDFCVETFCSKSSSANLNECLPSCTSYAAKTHGKNKVQATFAARMAACADRSRPFELGKPPKVSASASTNSRESTIHLYQAMQYGQRTTLIGYSEASTLASMQAEYAVGTLIAMVAVRYLLPVALSLLGGLGEALLNNKAIFPGSQHGAWILILTTAEVVPIYASLLAVFQQLVGDGVLAVTCILVVLYLSIGILTGHRILAIKSGQAEREKMYSRILCELCLRGFLIIAILVSLFLQPNVRKSGVRGYVYQELLTLKTIGISIIDVLAKKSLTAVAGTDVILGAFVSTEMWADGLPESDKKSHWEEVKEFDALKTLKKRTGDVVVPAPESHAANKTVSSSE